MQPSEDRAALEQGPFWHRWHAPFWEGGTEWGDLMSFWSGSASPLQSIGRVAPLPPSYLCFHMFGPDLAGLVIHNISWTPKKSKQSKLAASQQSGGIGHTCWRTLNKIKDTAFNDIFNQNKATSKQEISITIRDTSWNCLHLVSLAIVKIISTTCFIR